MPEGKRALPVPTPETQFFWDGIRAGSLLLQRCKPCERPYFPPRPFCPRCGGHEVEVFTATGRASLYSYVICYRPAAGFSAPYSIAVVELDEGPRMMTNIVGVAQTPEALILDMPLEVTFQSTDADIVPSFKPRGTK
jgi:uncharacterized OB-fold protein